MGLTQKLGTIPLAVFTDSSNNVGIGGAANASYKLQVTGSVNLEGNVTTTGAQFVQNGFYLTNANGGSAAGYTNMWGATDGIFFGLRNGTGGGKFIFQSATSYDYTFPAASGTLALTSNLSAYLPLTGGTLTGALSGTSATFTNTSTFRATGNAYTNGSIILQSSTGATSTYLTNSGGIFYLSNNGSTDHLQIASTGAATFSSSVTAGVITSSVASGTGTLKINNSSVSKAWSFYPTTNGSQTDITLYEEGTGLNIMTFKSGGNVGIGNTGASDVRLLIKAVDTTGSNYGLIVNNSSNANLLFVRNDGLILTGSSSASPYNLSTTGRNAVIESNGVLGYLVSTRESKANIKTIENVDFINQLNPVSFNYRKKDYNTNTFTDELYDNITYGFIADEVEQVNKELVMYNQDGSLGGVEYNSIIAILTKAVQELEARMKQLENK